MFKFILAALLLVPVFAQADCSSGSTTSCYDSCSGGFVPVVGDSCESYYDSSRGCFAARGTCSGNGSGSTNGCSGQSYSCYDSCSGAFVNHQDADSCTSAYNSSKGCFESLGYCSK